MRAAAVRFALLFAALLLGAPLAPGSARAQSCPAAGLPQPIRCLPPAATPQPTDQVPLEQASGLHAATIQQITSAIAAAGLASGVCSSLGYGPSGCMPGNAGIAAGINIAAYSPACTGVVDDSGPLMQAIAAATASGGPNVVSVPPGCRLGVNLNQITLANVKIVGHGPMDIGNNAACCSANYGRVGSQIWVLNPTASPFLLGSGVKFENLSFYWPNQTETYTTGGYPLFCYGFTGSAQTDTIVLKSPSLANHTVTASIPASSSAWQACTAIAQAINNDSTVTGAGGFAAAEGVPTLEQVITALALSAASVTASIGNGQIAVTAVASGNVVANQQITGAGVALGTFVAAPTPNALGGTGSYVLGNLSTTANGVSPANQAGLAVAGSAGVSNGWFVYDVTTPNAVPVGTSIASGAGTGSLTLSANLHAATANADVIVFASPQSVGSESMTLSGAGNNPLGTGYAPGDTGYLNGGSWLGFGQGLNGDRGQFKVTNTQVVNAAVGAAGSSCSGSSGTLTGTTGTGTRFQVVATFSGGAVTAINSITAPGSYTVNPTSLAAEPVTGASCSGVTLQLAMGALTLAVNNAGLYYMTAGVTASGVPSVFTQGNTTGAGAGLSVVPGWSGGIGTQSATAGGGLASLNGPVQLAAQPTIASGGGGAGCTAGTQTFTGTSGTGTKFTATGTVSGGALASISSYTAGNYAAEPGTYNSVTTTINETVSGAGCATAPTLNITLGPAITWTINTNGAHVTAYLGAASPAGPGMPVAYPPAMAQAAGDQINRFDFVGGQISNAFDFLYQGSTTNPIGQLHVAGDQVYAINNSFTITSQPEVSKIVDDYFSLGTFGPATFGPTFNMKEWSVDMGVWMHVPGNGTPSSAPTTFVQGTGAKSIFVYGIAQLLRVSTGSFQIGGVDAMLDSPMTVLQVDPSGGITTSDFTSGGQYWNLANAANPALPPPQPAVFINGPSQGNSVVKFHDIHYGYLDGSAYYATPNPTTGTNASLAIEHNTVDSMPAHHNLPVNFLQYIGGANAWVVATGNTLSSGVVTNTGIAIGGPTAFVSVRGNTFYAFGAPVAFLASASATSAIVTGNDSYFTYGQCSVCGTIDAIAAVWDNKWDIPNYAYDAVVRLNNAGGATNYLQVEGTSGAGVILGSSGGALNLQPNNGVIYFGNNQGYYTETVSGGSAGWIQAGGSQVNLTLLGNSGGGVQLGTASAPGTALWAMNNLGTVTETAGHVYRERTVTASGAITVAATDYHVCAALSVPAAVAVNLPAAPTVGAQYTISDCAGNAATYNLTVTPASGNIDGSSTFVIAENWGAWTGFYDGTAWKTVSTNLTSYTQVTTGAVDGSTTTTATINKNSGATWLDLDIVGPGGAGGNGISCGSGASCSGGAGGGSGGHTKVHVRWADLAGSPTSCSVSIPPAHLGGAASGGSNATVTCGSQPAYKAGGGGDGANGASAAIAAGGGGGGTTSGSVGTTSGGSGGGGAQSGGNGSANVTAATGGVGTGGAGSTATGAVQAGGLGFGAGSGGGSGGGCSSGTAAGAGGTGGQTLNSGATSAGANGNSDPSGNGSGGGGGTSSATNSGATGGGAGGNPGGGGAGGGDLCNAATGTAGTGGHGGYGQVSAVQY